MLISVKKALQTLLSWKCLNVNSSITDLFTGSTDDILQNHIIKLRKNDPRACKFDVDVLSIFFY